MAEARFRGFDRDRKNQMGRKYNSEYNKKHFPLLKSGIPLKQEPSTIKRIIR